MTAGPDDAGHYVLGLDGEPLAVDWPTWAVWFERIANRRVAYTNLGAGSYVSTVFIGLDYGIGPPVLWETMTFGVPGLEETQRRHHSRAAALAGHAEAVALARLALRTAARRPIVRRSHRRPWGQRFRVKGWQAPGAGRRRRA